MTHKNQEKHFVASKLSATSGRLTRIVFPVLSLRVTVRRDFKCPLYSAHPGIKLQVYLDHFQGRGVPRLDGIRGKKQVWRPHVRTQGLLGVNLLYWSTCDIAGTFRRSSVIPGALCTPCPPWLRLRSRDTEGFWNYAALVTHFTLH